MEVYRKISQGQLLVYQRRGPKLSDLELIALSQSAEYMCIDGENDLFREPPYLILHRIERSIYNRRRKRLTTHIRTDSFETGFSV